MLLVSGLEESLEYFPWQRVCIDASSPRAPIFLPSSVHAARGKHFSRKPQVLFIGTPKLIAVDFSPRGLGTGFHETKTGKAAANGHGMCTEREKDKAIRVSTRGRTIGRVGEPRASSRPPISASHCF